MKKILRTRYMSFSLLASIAGGSFSANGCTTTAVNGDAGGSSGGGSSSGSSGGSGSSSGASSSSSGGGSSSGSGGSGGASSSSSGASSSGSGGSSSSGSAGDGGVPTVSCYPPPGPTGADGGSPVIIPPSNARTQTPTNDAGVNLNAQWGTFTAPPSPPFGAGTYFYPPGPGTDVLANDAGIACTSLFSQSSFSAAYTIPNNTWKLSGTVAGYSGVGMYIGPCIDAHNYSGIQFTVSGNVGNASPAVGDAGAGVMMTLAVTQLSNAMVSDAGGFGTCPTTCTPASFPFAVTSTPTTVLVHWTDFTGGSPSATIDNPGQITGLQWALPWPCTAAPTPYNTSVIISNIEFVP